MQQMVPTADHDLRKNTLCAKAAHEHELELELWPGSPLLSHLPFQRAREALTQVRSDASWNASLENDPQVVPQVDIRHYRNWRFVRQLIVHKNRIHLEDRKNPQLLDRFDGRIRLLAIKDDLWGEKNGIRYEVYADGSDFGTTHSKLRDDIHESLDLGRRDNDGCIIFYTVGRCDVSPEAVIDTFMSTFGTNTKHGYCGFCDQRTASYEGIVRYIRVSVKQGAPGSGNANYTYHVPVHAYFVITATHREQSLIIIREGTMEPFISDNQTSSSHTRTNCFRR